MQVLGGRGHLLSTDTEPPTWKSCLREKRERRSSGPCELYSFSASKGMRTGCWAQRHTGTRRSGGCGTHIGPGAAAAPPPPFLPVLPLPYFLFFLFLLPGNDTNIWFSALNRNRNPGRRHSPGAELPTGTPSALRPHPTAGSLQRRHAARQTHLSIFYCFPMYFGQANQCSAKPSRSRWDGAFQSLGTARGERDPDPIAGPFLPSTAGFSPRSRWEASVRPSARPHVSHLFAFTRAMFRTRSDDPKSPQRVMDSRPRR